MKLSYLALALLVSCVVYLAGMLAFSTYSQSAFDRLSAHAERLEKNVGELRDLNRRLVARADLYRRNSDAVAVEARRLQYYEPGQGVIRLAGEHARVTVTSPGAIVRRPPEGRDHARYVRIAALVSFVLTFLGLLVADSGERRPAQEMRRASR